MANEWGSPSSAAHPLASGARNGINVTASGSLSAGGTTDWGYFMGRTDGEGDEIRGDVRSYTITGVTGAMVRDGEDSSAPFVFAGIGASGATDFTYVATKADVGGNAVFDVAAAIPEDVTRLGLRNGSSPLSPGAVGPVGDMMQGLLIEFAPEITVEQSRSRRLVDGRSMVSFGAVKRGRRSAAKTFRIVNDGSLDLTGMAATKFGPRAWDFVVNAPSRKAVAPGDVATFQVTFAPR